MDKSICAVITAYHPDIHVLQQLIRAIRQDVSAIVVVDNTPWTAHDAIPAAVGETAYIPMGENKGISRAFNAGVDWAKSRGHSHVLLMDQDSQPHDGMIERLSDAEDSLLEQGHKVAAVGPKYIDPKYRVIRPFSRTEKWRVRRYQCRGDDGPAFIQSDFVISSGSLVRIAVLDSVGGFDEKLFIDYVDIEWGLRANSLGFASFGVCDAVLKHSLAEEAITFWFLKTWSVPVPKTFRHYYCFRNALLLYRRPYVPWSGN
jgi:rhamnosyltransferase